MIVTLSESELALAGMVAVQRQAQNRALGRKDRYGASKEHGLELHFTGCQGELVVAKTLNRYWSGRLGEMRAGDVGKVQVRTTTRSDGDLILHPEDRDEDIFVLVRILDSGYDVRGYLRAKEGKIKGPGGYWVPDGERGPNWRAAFAVPGNVPPLHPMPNGKAGNA